MRVGEGLKALLSRLDEADNLRGTDPKRAESMYRAVIELYAQKPWAADAVRRAREAVANFHNKRERSPRRRGEELVSVAEASVGWVERSEPHQYPRKN